MPKQRVRRIVVDGVAYRWRVRAVDPDWIALRFWHDGDRVPLADVRIRFDDPWLHYPEMLVVAREAPERFAEVFAMEPVVPARVAELIRECAGHSPRIREFEIVDGALRPVRTPT